MNRLHRPWLPLLLVSLSVHAADPATLEHARELTQSLHLVDGHIDVPHRIEEEWVDVTRATAEGDFDLPRARAGGLNTPFMSIYTPASAEPKGESWQRANQLIDAVEALVARAPGEFALVRSVAEAEQARRERRIGLALGMENGGPIDGSLERLRHFHDRGIRYITLAHSRSNHLADSSYDEVRIWGGLSPFGREVVAEMNRLGIMIDVSHLSDDAFWDVLELSAAPVVASHSSARHFTPGFERNLSDEMIAALGAHGGVVMINFGSGFLTAEARQWGDRWADAVRDPWLDEHGLSRDDAAAEALEAAYREAHPYPYATVSDVADHVERVVQVAGIDHVGIGSDFDGVGDSLPVGLKDVGDYPNLVAELLDRGFGDEDIARLLGDNVLRVWLAVEAAAQRGPE